MSNGNSLQGPERRQDVYYGITVMRNGQVVGAKDRSNRSRVKRFIARNPGARLEDIAKGARCTTRAAQIAIDSLQRAGEIYANPDGPYAKWYAGERRETPRGLLTSIWDMADRLASSGRGEIVISDIA